MSFIPYAYGNLYRFIAHKINSIFNWLTV